MEKKTLLQRVKEAIVGYENVYATYVYTEEKVTIIVENGNWTEELGQKILQTLTDAEIPISKTDHFEIPYWAWNKDEKTGKFIPNSMKPRVMTIYSY